MNLYQEGSKLYLIDRGKKTDIGLPIQSVLDSMSFQVKRFHDGTIYMWNDDAVYVWREDEGWAESRKLDDVMDAQGNLLHNMCNAGHAEDRERLAKELDMQDEHRFVVTDENLDEMEAKFHAMSEDDPDFKALADALHRWLLG